MKISLFFKMFSEKVEAMTYLAGNDKQSKSTGMM